jgi:hypothetical protein
MIRNRGTVFLKRFIFGRFSDGKSTWGQGGLKKVGFGSTFRWKFSKSGPFFDHFLPKSRLEVKLVRKRLVLGRLFDGKFSQKWTLFKKDHFSTTFCRKVDLESSYSEKGEFWVDFSVKNCPKMDLL